LISIRTILTIRSVSIRASISVVERRRKRYHFTVARDVGVSRTTVVPVSIGKLESKFIADSKITG
jgi:hypothetical protein